VNPFRRASDRAKHRAMARCEQEWRRTVAEEIARAIEDAAPGTCLDPDCDPKCSHHWLRRQAMADARLAREAGSR
jgi:hypothetical protein